MLRLGGGVTVPVRAFEVLAIGLAVGVAVERALALFGVTLTLTPTVHLVAAALLCALALWATARLRAGPAGLEAAALRDDRELALTLGAREGRRRVELTAATGALGAAAGAGASLLAGVAAPADLSPLLSLQLFAAAVVGGSAPVAGPLLGFAALAAIPRLADALSALGASEQSADGVITAALLVACVVLRPRVAVLTRRPAAGPGAGRGTAGAGSSRRPVGARARRPARRSSDPLRRRRRYPARPHPRRDRPERQREDDAPARWRASCPGPVTGPRAVRTLQRAAGFASLTPYRQLRLALQCGDPVRLATLAHFACLADPASEAEHDRRARALLTVVFAEQSLALARRVADRIVLVADGAVALAAPRATALADPRLGDAYLRAAEYSRRDRGGSSGTLSEPDGR